MAVYINNKIAKPSDLAFVPYLTVLKACLDKYGNLKITTRK